MVNGKKNSNTTENGIEKIKNMGYFLAKFREVTGLNQECFGRSIHVNQTSISRFERGTRTPSTEVLKLYVDYNPKLFKLLLQNQSFPEKFQDLLIILERANETESDRKPDPKFDAEMKQLSALLKNNSLKSYLYHDEEFKIDTKVSFNPNRLFVELPEFLGIPPRDFFSGTGISVFDCNEILKQENEISGNEVDLVPLNKKFSGLPSIIIQNPDVEISTLCLAWRLYYFEASSKFQELITLIF